MGSSDRCYRVAGSVVPFQRLLPCIERALVRLPLEDRRLLLDFHAGFCCAELSARCNLSEAAVKTRLHRARRRVQKEIEACVRAAGDLDAVRDPDEGEP
jgi:DNA-directed RNA polymerase specialized sigma24 family protein